MVDFDMVRSNLAIFSSSRDHFFLTSAINWEPVSTRKIGTKIKKVEIIYQIIHTYFKLNTKPWQVEAIIDITKYRKDVCAIVGINTDKSFVYQSILIITDEFVLVISPIITLIKEQI